MEKGKDKKDKLIHETKIPIKKFKCGIIEDSWYDSFHLITHLIYPGYKSFEEYKFTPIIKTINIQSIEPKPNTYCLVQLKGDEYWRYSKFGNFSDFFNLEYIVFNQFLVFKASDSKNMSEETSFVLSEEHERIINTSLGKFKISFVEQIKPFNISLNWTCNILVKEITNIIKEKDVLWMIELNKNSLGYTYDGNINKYITININSLQSDEIELILYKEEKGSKKEYAKGFLIIYGLEIGITQEYFFKKIESLY